MTIATRLFVLLLFVISAVSGQVAQTGQWTPLQNWPFVPVSVAHLSDGRLVAWASTQPTTFPAGATFTYAAIYDPSTGQITNMNHTAHDMFCAGLASTGDGRIIASGGGSDVRSTSTIGMIPRWPQSWSRLGDMLSGRWYNSSITLPSGNLLTMWGRSGGTLTETFNQTTNTWSAMSGISITSASDASDGVDDDHQWFPHLHHMPNGKILMAGPLKTMRWIDYTGLGSWQDIGPRTPDGIRHRKLGASVQYLPGKILVTGGRDDRFSPSVTATAVIIDATSGTPVTTSTASMSYARAFHNLVMLPNGEVFAGGGNTTGAKFSDGGGVTIPEIWNPATGLWRSVAPLAVARGYHLVSILLRDGRVLIGGGGLCGCSADHRDTQIYSPGYLFNSDGTTATRPTIDLVSPDLKAGITVGLKGSDNITGFRLIRLQATTHGINSDQRYVPVNFTKVAPGNYNLSLESSENVLIPGMYWLFALTAAGTPSIGYPVQVFTPSTWPGDGSNDTNLAKAKSVTQSSTELAAAASRAVDGNTNGELAQNSVSQTQLQAQPYWQLDLGANAALRTVRLWNRTDCCADRLTNFHVFVSLQPITGATVAEVQAQAGVLDFVYPGTAPVMATIPVNTSGRYVRVQLDGTGYLQLAEVEVMGSVVTNIAPQVTLTSPANGATGTAPASFTMQATATDVDGNLARVEFYAGALKLGEAVSAPYIFNWSNVAAGSYTLKARAIDAAGLFAESSVAVTVTPPVVANRVPVVSIASPVDGLTIPAPGATSIEVNATDPDGNLARVELLQGGVAIAELTSGPFLFSVNNLNAGTYTFTAKATDLLGLSASTTITVRVLTRQLQSLKGVPVPEPSALMAFVKNRNAAIALGKALFWDTQVSSDGKIACASCHFQAGADPRLKHQMNPGTLRSGSPQMTFDNSRTGVPNGPNYVVKPGDFPRHELSNPQDPNSTVVYQSKDVMGSHGVFLRDFVSAEPGASEDACVASVDPVFGSFRRTTGRNSPTVVNAVFNVRNFWDGRANSTFNGVDSFGPRNSTAVIYRGTPPVAISVALDNASLASQAVAAPLNSGEMSCAGRTWPEIGKRLLGARGLAGQNVASSDSVLSPYVAVGGAPGLAQTYDAMVRAAFFDDLHTSAVPITVGGKSYSQIQANFSLFFGLAVQMYESTLVSDQAPIDSYFANYPSTGVSNASAMTPEAVAGMNVFNGKGRCVSCHHGPQLTNAGTPAREAAAIGALISRMRMGNGEAGVYDLGFYNLGVRPTGEDLGLGGSDPFGNSLSFSRQAKAGVLKDLFTVTTCTFEMDPCLPLQSGSRDVVDGAFKTPTLRNVSLTGPYFHNGSAATLEDVVAFYDRGGNATGTTSANSTGWGGNTTNAHADIRPLALTTAEKTALVTFLKFALLDDRVAYERAPFDHPELPIPNGQTGATTDLVLVPVVGSAGRAQPVRAFEEIVVVGDLGLPSVSVSPIVALTSPAAGASFVAPAGVTITAMASTTQGTISQVEFFNGATLLGVSVSAPYSFNWANVAAGSYAITAKATGSNSLTTTSAPVNITVTAAAAPTVALTSPAAGASFVAPAGVTIAASASTTQGTISQVEFFNGATLLGVSVSAPYSFNWANVAAGSYAITAKATGSNSLTTTSAPVNITVTAAAAPTVALTSPAAGASFVAPAGVTIAASASTTQGTISQVEFFNGATLLGVDASAPYSFNWANVAAGSYTITAKATGSNGLTTTSAPVNITVTAAAAPTVALTSPVGGSTLIAPATIAITATASTTQGTISQVEFFNGATLLGVDASVPYSFNWANVAAGSYTITAKATGSNGLTTTSAPVNITVTAAAAPTVALTSPVGGSTLIAPATIAITAIASTTQGTVSRVEFYNGATLIGSDTSSPFRYDWTNVAVGTYSITARAFGSNGLSAVTAPLSVTVTAASGLPVAIGMWPMDAVTNGQAVDISGNDNRGLVTGPFSLGAGKIGQAIQLDPAIGGILTQRAVIDPTKSYTVALWVKLNSTAGTQTFVSLPAVSVSNFYLQLAGWLHGGFAMDVYPSDSTSVLDYVAASTTIPVANQWYHVAGVFDATAKHVQVYVNGQMENQVPAPGGGFVNTRPLAFGYSLYSGSRYDGNDANVDDVRVYGAALTPSEVLSIFNDVNTGAIPSVALTSPAAGASFVAPAGVTITATAATTQGTISQVEFFNGATLLGVDASAPYSFNWANVAAGSYTITAKATGSNNLTTTSAPVNITVTAAAAPSISLTSPAAGASFVAPAGVTITASAATTQGTISQVEFFNGATLLGVSVSAPYSFNWANVAAGSYTITAKATGSNNLTTTSAPVNITVAAAAAPTVALTSPAAGASFVAPAGVTITASAATTQGTISQVEFFNGATLLGVSVSAPYSFNWANVAAGSYTITAKATGSNNLTTTSAPVNITVTAAAAPSISLTSPAAGASFVAPASVTITATAATTQGTISQVEFFNGATLLGVSVSAPYSFNWANVAAGSYTITAKATGSNSLTTTSAPVNITVTAAAAPSISLTSPAAGASFVAPASVTITATAATTQGTISQVEFFNGATLLGVDASAPYSFNWANVAAGSYTITAKATGSNNLTTTSAPVNITVTAAAAPSISLTSPAAGASFVAPAGVTITASAATTQGTISQVEFFNGATLLGVSVSAPYSFNWANVAAGSYTITAKATGSNSLTTTSAPVNITVTAAAAPSISLTSPAAGASFVAPASVTITATAATTQGTISQVEFFNGATLLGVDASAPYSFNWANVAAGSYTITAKATGSNSLTTTSAPVNITVTAAAAPSISLTSPAAGASFVAPASVTITATAATTQGTISQVEFFNGATLLGVDASAPYSFNWANVAAGSYTITAKATGSNSLTTTSAPVNITVTAAAAPTVALTSPASGTSTIAPTTINIAASATTTQGTISQVEFYSGATLLGTDNALPYSFSWANVPAGIYTITAKATGSNGLSTSTAPVTITVLAPIAPTVSLTAPSNGINLTAPATIAITANASTTQGTIAQVDFYNGATLLGSDTTAPYSYNWMSVAAGTYSITARAIGSNSLTSISTAVSVTVTAAAGAPTPAGWWPLDAVTGGQTPDTSGNNNSGTVSGTYNLAAGQIGQGIQLNPLYGGIVTQRSVMNAAQSYSVSVWVKLTQTSGTQTFVSLPGNVVSTFYLQLGGWLNGGFVMDVYPNDSTTVADYAAASTTIPVANQWYHVTGVHDATAKQVRIYVNGVLEGQVSAPNGSFANTGPLAFGYSKYDRVRYDGNDARIDDIRVFNKVLTAAEILAVFNSR